MVHVLFLVASLTTVALEQVLLLKLLPKIRGWRLRQGLQIMALGMPLAVMALFSLTMSPAVLFPEYDHDHKTNNTIHQEWLLGVAAFSLLAIPVAVALVSNLFRLGWLYWRTFRNTWAAPAGMEALINRNMSRSRRPLKIRLWYSARPFAFNLPGSFLCQGVIILSTGLVGGLEKEELQAVIWHEQAHLVRRDFWTIWFATWSAAAFFYMPTARTLVELVKEDQELACDEKVATFGGTSVALALADALLKVWETLLAFTRLSGKTGIKGFEAPGLASDNVPTLTEQRVNRLIEFSSTSQVEFLRGKTSFFSKPFLAFTLSLGMWSLCTWIIHLLCPELG